MKGLLPLIMFILIAAPQWVGAEIYKWVDENGKTHYSDKAPASAKTQEIKVRISTYSSPSYSPDILKPDPSNKPSKKSSRRVTLYSTTWCGVCHKAKAYFKQNNIPFTEYDVETSAKGKKDFEKMNGRGVPIILVGNQRMNGFSKPSFEQLYRK